LKYRKWYERRKFMKNKKTLENHDRYISWDEFKKQYLSKVEYLAQIVGLDRDKIVIKDKLSLDGEDEEENIMDDDHIFVDGVMKRIIDWEDKYVKRPLLFTLMETDGAEEIFDEVYRIWAFRFCRGDELLFPRRPKGRGTRSEPGKGDLVDIFLIGRSLDSTTLLNHGFGEDFADCIWPVAVKVKQKSCMSNDGLIMGLRDLADALEAGFKNCYLPSSDGYLPPSNREEQAILCGLYKNSPDLHAGVTTNPGYPLHKAIRDAGWLDPDLTLDTGLGEMLQRGWPDLYEGVLDGELSPFEALLKTGWVNSEDVYEIFGKYSETRDDVEDKIADVDHLEGAIDELLQEMEEI
jgi:hypothetical protein